MKKNNNKGFTLVELLVVIAIIGILAVVAVPALFKNIEKGKVADLEADISAIRSATLSYYADKSEYPIDDSTATSSSENNYTPTPAIVILQEHMDSLLNDKLKKQGTIALLSELEGLSFPYKGKYELTDVTGENVQKSPGVLYLKITTDGVNSTISDSGLDKLARDLGLEKVSANTTKIEELVVSGGTSGPQTLILPLIKN